MDEFTVSEGRNMKEEDQNKKLEFVKKVKETKFNQELFFKQMKLFSQFVTYTNPDYMCNETYLLRFCQQKAKKQNGKGRFKNNKKESKRIGKGIGKEIYINI